MAMFGCVSSIMAMLSPSKIQGMTGEHSLGGASDHNKAENYLYSHIKRDSVLKACLLGRHALGTMFMLVKPKI